MLILFCGDRNWTATQPILDALHRFNPEHDTIMHGAARGADSIAGRLATDLGFAVRIFPANWELYNKAAGFIRNKQMLDQNPDLVLAFHPDINLSKGTKHMVRIARAKGTPVEVFSDREVFLRPM